MQRRVTGLLRLFAALGLAVTIGVQITDRVVNDAFDPWEYFSYFTIDTSLIDVVVLAAGGVIALMRPRDSAAFTSIRLAALCYAIVTGAVYNLLLRSVPPTGYPGLDWPNEVLHVWLPLVLVADWVLATGRARLRWRSVWLVPVFPIAWALYSFGRAAASGGVIYPYPFLDPATDGWAGVIGYVVGLTAALTALGAVGAASTRIRSPFEPRRSALDAR
jgi:hypothetical protein